MAAHLGDVVLGLQLWQWFLIAVLVFICGNYLLLMFYDRVVRPARESEEGFTNAAGGEGLFQNGLPAEGPSSADDIAATAPLAGQQQLPQKTQPSLNLDDRSAKDWLNNLSLYDDFFAGVYDKLVQGEKRSAIEVALLETEWRKVTSTMQLKEWRVLDVGCGTGLTAAAFAKLGAGKVVGLDRSEPMLRRARTITVPASTLTDAQVAAIEWRNGDVERLEVAQQGEFTHACVMYFSFYYIQDKAAFFRNMKYWIIPGGALSIHVVNKGKFDPMLEAAAPTVFSLQKYTNERIMKSQVAFDTFDYEGVFDVDETPGATAAEFRETFRFKDGTIRRQKHTFDMPEMKDIVALGQTAGWNYRGYIDNTSSGFEYTYTLLFTH
jgi:SAM-dependent methyltransferase